MSAPSDAEISATTAPLPDHMLTTWKYLGFSASLKGDPFEDVE